MKFVPVSNGIRSSARITAPSKPHHRTLTPSAMVLKGAVVGLFGGLFIIGMMENFERLSDPHALGAAEPVAIPQDQGAASSDIAMRADRLDLSR